MAEDIDQAQDEQRTMILKVDAPVPVVPSVHASRLGVHEHPSVRDGFRMKIPYDVTAGAGFHVTRINGIVNTSCSNTTGIPVSGDPVDEEQSGDESGKNSCPQ